MWCPGSRRIKHQSPVLVKKCCIIQSKNIFFSSFFLLLCDSNQIRWSRAPVSLLPPLAVSQPASWPWPNFIWETSFSLSPTPTCSPTTLVLLCLWIQCAVALWFTCLTNMDRGPKWFLKSSNGLERACAAAGGNTPSVCLRLSFPSVCGCVWLCVLVSLSVYVYVSNVCVHALSQTPMLDDGSARQSGSLEMR